MPLPDNAMKVAKINEDEQLVFGWASVSMTKDDQLVIDSHGDVIEPEELENAAYEFMREFRKSGEGHKGEAISEVVESVVITPQKAAAMGIEAPHTGWWIGVKIGDAETFAKVKSGEYEMFSIEGTAEVVDVEYEGMTVIGKQLANDVFRQLRDAGNERWGGADKYVFVDDFDVDTPQAVFCIGGNGEETMIGVTFERAEDGSISLGADEAEVERRTVYERKPASAAY